ncbi:MAG: glycosyltransferase family 4 protein [Candidatus Omnitrophota bacterium]|nr:glycosyltransferase family 4 protein [Candidatus Omnitrophota bacterium]
MRIANIIQRYYPAIGGSETWCQGMCRYLARQGHQVRVLTLNVYNEDEYWQDPLPDNCLVRLGRADIDRGIFVRRYARSKIPGTLHKIFGKILYRGFKLYFYGPHSWEMYVKLAEEIRRADIVHLHTAPYPHNFIGYCLAKALGKPVAITPHFHPGHPFYELPSNYWLINGCDAVFTVSDFEKEYFVKKGINKRKIFVAYNAIEPAEYAPRNLEAFREELCKKYQMSNATKKIVFIGRKIEYKGVDILIEAASKLMAKMDLRLFLVGPDFPWFSRHYSALPQGIRDKVIDLGVIDEREKVNLLHTCDVLALPSRHEAFGIVFLEAWICGLPVVGADTGWMPHLLKDNGLISRYGDSNDLAQKLEKILTRKDLANEMAHNGRNKVMDHYVWDAVGGRILDVYRSLLEKRLSGAKKW